MKKMVTLANIFLLQQTYQGQSEEPELNGNFPEYIFKVRPTHGTVAPVQRWDGRNITYTDNTLYICQISLRIRIQQYPYVAYPTQDAIFFQLETAESFRNESKHFYTKRVGLQAV